MICLIVKECKRKLLKIMEYFYKQENCIPRTSLIIIIRLKWFIRYCYHCFQIKKKNNINTTYNNLSDRKGRWTNFHQLYLDRFFYFIYTFLWKTLEPVFTSLFYNYRDIMISMTRIFLYNSYDANPVTENSYQFRYSYWLF